MVKIKSPIVREIEYSNNSLVNLKSQLKSSEHKNDMKLLFDYPVVYIVNDNKNDQFSVYVGETADIIRRTSQHLTDDIKKENRDDWRDFATSSTTKMFIIYVTISPSRSVRCETNKPPAMRVRVEGYTKKLQTRYNKGVQANCKAKGEKYGTKGS